MTDKPTPDIEAHVNLSEMMHRHFPLIITAPALLEFAEEAYKVTIDIVDGYINELTSSDCRRLGELQDKARALIAQAKGEKE